ncbi:MAG: hypothetical protein WAW17_16330 [Rhodococcus sp. (in: high G+C Gram-positive bacteria)]|uniref:hypothetical protein n=1 Tax=Rhodococcus sp. TaxID=1831 RepID=UPI003BB1833F
MTTPPAAEASGGFDVLPTFGHSVGLTPHGGASSALVMSVALGAAGGDDMFMSVRGCGVGGAR